MAATLKLDTITNASNTGAANLTLDASGNATVGNTLVMGSSFKRNRIINGNMVVNQRTTAVSSNAFTVDRWNFIKSNDATESVAQNTDAPAGFSYSLRNTISVADTSIGSTQFTAFGQAIEGYNIADLGFGTANAKTVTLSFWVKATQTGTYSALLQGGSPERQVFKAFSVSASNTWEYKTLTFVGDTNTGSTWNLTNGLGLQVVIYSALGSSFINGTDGVWAATSTANYGPSGMANALSANGNIFAFTGVQLEVGSVATPYERQIYSDQLIQCQRYLPAYNATISTQQIIGYCMLYNTTSGNAFTWFQVQPRVPPTGATLTGTFKGAFPGVNTFTLTPTFEYASYIGARFSLAGTALTASSGGFFVSESSNAQILFTGSEL
jgi:hypothetical protein